MKHRYFYLAVFTLLTGLNACSERADTKPFEKTELQFEEADSFLQFVNTQASLSAGKYKLVVASKDNNTSGSYEISIDINGKTETLKGKWKSTPKLDLDKSPSHNITLDFAGGLTTETDTKENAYLYLLKNDVIVAEGKEIDLPVSQINSQAYTDAYYKAVDPKNDRKTLSGWQKVNGFNRSEDVHVIFRDTKDLGYGRNMHVRQDNDGNVSIFVRNYAADLGTADGQYNRANLTAAINEMDEYHIGTNAIEFSPIDPNNPNSEKILKFFNYQTEEDRNDGEEYRQDKVDLDQRGAKHMPLPCLVCHGARLLPLDQNGDFQLISLKTAKLNQLEVETFEFAEAGMYEKSELEAELKAINQYVNQVYQEIGEQKDTNFNRWDSEFALELSQGRYGGKKFPLSEYDETFIPEGWLKNESRPDGVEELFSGVIQPHCISCHSIRGKTVAEINNDSNDINFSSYEKFASYNDKIIDYVYKRGVMPLSLLNYKAFWAEPEGAPALLASFLEGFDLYDNKTSLPVEPGRPFAFPGEDRTAWSPVQLQGGASPFAKRYEWTIVSKPLGSSASFDNANRANPIFKGNTDGDYVLELKVSNGLGNDKERVTITIDESVTSPLSKHQSELTFVDDIMGPILDSGAYAPGGTSCAGCHRSRKAHLASSPSYDGKYDGIPVFYSYYEDEDLGAAKINKNLYRHVRARVNLAEPENSLLLRKPTGNHHGGAVRIDRDTLAGEQDYQILLNWIAEGAICGDHVICQ